MKLLLKNPLRPPRSAEKVIAWLIDPLVRDQALGDIEEHFHWLVFHSKPVWARLWYVLQIFPVMKSFILNSAYWGGAMFRHYLKTALRNFRRQKGYSLLNIFGLALGMACSILIAFYIRHELSYDRFHANADGIFRVTIEGLVGGNPVNMAVTPNPLATSLSTQYPEVLAAARIRRSGAVPVKFADREFMESGIVYADPGLFEVFTFPLIRGDAKTALDRPSTVVLTERAAKKYFGTEEPLGKFLKFDNQSDFLVTGVIKDLPHQSHLAFDLVCSLETDFAEHAELRENWYGHSSSLTYIRLDRSQARGPLEGKLPGLIDEKMGKGLQASKARIQLRLQPLTDIHLRSRLRFEFGGNGDILNIYIFAAIAVIILAIASVNFMNLATARSARRAREVGLRKVVGACRRDLIGQFLAESIGSSLFALMVALAFVILALPLFKSISGIELTLGPGQLAWLIPMSFGLALVLGFVAGSYPAFYLSAFQPVKTLKGGPGGGAEAKSGSVSFRRFLVVGQFTLSIFMISGTRVIDHQLRYMKNKDLGFQKDQVLAVRTSDDKILRTLDQVKSRLKEIPGVLEVSATTFVPGQGQSINPVVPEGFAENATVGYRQVAADADYIRTLGMEIVKGRDFSKYVPSDEKDSILVNETAVRELGWDDPIGKTMKIATGELFQYSTKTIVGVVRDFHYSSLRNSVEPLYISNEMKSMDVLAVKIKTDQTGRIVRELKKAWETVSPGKLFNFFFLDELFDAQYRSEERLNKIFSSFSLIAIAIACLGLFGLASYMAERRKKEVSIRKVLGATSREMVGLLSRDFLRLVALAALIAWPTASLAMNAWLRGFASRTPVSPWTFIFSGLAGLAIAFLTVSYQAVRAAAANPADSLKHE
jgi:putative ABC transport system permease protein